MAAKLNLTLADSAGSSYDLAALGTADFFVYPNSTTRTEKNSATDLALTLVSGTAALAAFNGTTTTLSWSNGTPTASGSTNGGVFTANAAQGKGYIVTAPAGTGTRTLRIFLGAYQTTAKIEVALSDGSAAAITDTSTVHAGADGSLATMRVATITYEAGSDGQTLTVTVTNNTTAGNINIQGAALTTSVLAAATDITISGPNSGAVGSPSSNFTVGANGPITGAITVAPSDNGGGGSFNPSSVAISAATPTRTFTYTPASSGAKSITVTNNAGLANPAAISYTASAPPVQAPITDPNVVWSPYNWDDYGTYKSANNCGAYARLGFTGTSITVNLDISHMVAASLPAGQYPIVRTIIDGAAFVDTQLTSSTTALTRSGLSDSAHTLEVVFLAAHTTTPDRWNTPVSAVRVTGFTLDSGKATAAHATRPKNLIFYGDSITEGYLSLGTTTTIPAGNSSLHTAVPSIARALDAEFGQIGFGAQGYAQAGQGNVPNLNSAWGLYSAGRSRLVGGLLSPAPDYICVEHGTNGPGSTTQAVVQTTITNLRAAAPNARIFMMVPANGSARAAITAAVNANSSDTKLHLIDLGTSYQAGIEAYGSANMWTIDGLHRNTLSNARVAAGFTAKMQAAIGGVSTTPAPSDATNPVLTGQLAVSSVTANAATLTWPTASDNVGVAGYEYSLDAGSTWAPAGSQPTVGLTGLAASTTFQVRVRAYDEAGNRSSPLSASFTTAAPAGDGASYTASTARTVTVGVSPKAFTAAGDFWTFGGDKTPRGPKDPDSTIDITFDWSAWLADMGNPGLANVNFILSGVQSAAGSTTGAKATVFLSGGSAGAEASITCRVTTASSPARIEDRTVYLSVGEQ